MQSIVSYPVRGEGGLASYRGNCAPQLVEDLIDQFHPKLAVDPMIGGGTSRDVCARRNVPFWGSDLKAGFDVLTDEIPVGADLLFNHPPYWNIIAYSSDPRDLSAIQDYGTFIKQLNLAMFRMYESIRSGGHLAVLVGDVKRKGLLYPIMRDMHWYGEPVNVVIKEQHNTTSGRTGVYAGKFIPIVHEYLVITRKPMSWFVTIHKAETVKLDTRKLTNCSWRSMVQTALEELGGEAELQDIYGLLEEHATAKNSNTWKEHIRQALQLHFVSVERGRWKLQQFPLPETRRDHVSQSKPC